jgi:hypothetical protein
MRNSFGEDIPSFLIDEKSEFWSSIIMVIFVFPLSLMRKFSEFRFVTLSAVFATFFVSFTGK